MRILIVGAGAVGQVFGRHLTLGGASVAYFVKPKYAQSARDGFPLYPLNRRNPRRAPVRFEDFEVLTSLDEIAAETWDLVLLTTASDALHRGDWVREIGEATGDAMLIGLQPGLDDPDFVRERVGAHRVGWGLIEFLAYPGPLPGEHLPEPGIAYWIPPLMTFPFSGPDARVRSFVSILNAGGIPSRHVDDAIPYIAFGAPLLNLHIAALEASGWRFDTLRRDPVLLPLAIRAVRQTFTLVARELELPEPRWGRLLRPWQARMLTRVLPHVVPMPFETYLQRHFTKVRQQTLEMLAHWRDRAQALELPHDALDELSTLLHTPPDHPSDEPSRVQSP